MKNRQTEFEALRPYLTGLAFRMLGSRADAEDAVQDCWLRLMQASSEPDNIKAWLTRVCTNICLDSLRRLKRERERYEGPWLPDPIRETEKADESYSDPAELAETLQQSYLLLLERLTPGERASLILHDVFGFSFEEVGNILKVTAATARQHASRARKHLKASKTRFDASTEDLEMLGGRLYAAVAHGDIDGIVDHLANDVELWTDGGGKALAARNIIYGATNVAAFLSGVIRKMDTGFEVEAGVLNGKPAVYVRTNDGSFDTLSTFSCNTDGYINRIFVHRNPDKLSAFPHEVALV